MKILLSLCRILGHVWSFPNTLIALLFGIGGRAQLDWEARIIVIRGGWMVRIFSRLGFAGMCVGDVVLSQHDLAVRWPHIYRHELVHASQARIFGPLYLPLTLLGYLYGWLRFPRDAHDASPLEVWADTASGNSANNTFLKTRAEKAAAFGDFQRTSPRQ